MLSFLDICMQLFHIILTLKDSSRFSPPQISMPASYVPMCSKYFLLMANRPPAMVGDLILANHTDF